MNKLSSAETLTQKIENALNNLVAMQQKQDISAEDVPLGVATYNIPATELEDIRVALTDIQGTVVTYHTHEMAKVDKYQPGPAFGETLQAVELIEEDQSAEQCYAERRLHQEVARRKQVEAELDTIFGMTPDAVLFTDTNRQFVKMNAAFTRLFNYTLEEVLGKDTKIIYANPLDYHKEGELRYHPDADERLEPYEIIYRRANGEVFVSESIGALVKDHEGSLLGYLTIIRDVTERKRIELEKAHLFEAVSQQREQLRALTGRLAEAQEAERKALARELHDQVGQNLTALDLNLNIVYSRCVKSSFDDRQVVLDRLKDSLGLINQTADRIRNLMVDLRPPLLDDYGLVAALRWFGEQFASRVDFSVTTRGREPEPRLAGSLEDTLFRVTQEALTNVAKHAQAKEVLIEIESDNEFTRLEISDDGSGFDLSQWSDIKRRKHWGLITMVERAEAMGGYCHIDSERGRGTRILVELPR